MDATAEGPVRTVGSEVQREKEYGFYFDVSRTVAEICCVEKVVLHLSFEK